MAIGRRELGAILLGIATIVFYLVLLSTTPSGAQTGGNTTNGTTSQNGDDLSCSDNEDLVDTFTGTEDDTVGPFEITGDEFRVVFEATTTSSSDGDLSVDVLDEDGLFVGSGFVAVIPDLSDTETDDTGVIDGPGTFTIEVDANGVDYEIIVCQDQDQGNGGQTTQNRTTQNRTTLDEDGSNQGGRTVINVPDKPLPPSGGLPVYGVVAGCVLAGAGLLALGLGIRHGTQR